MRRSQPGSSPANKSSATRTDKRHVMTVVTVFSKAALACVVVALGALSGCANPGPRHQGANQPPPYSNGPSYGRGQADGVMYGHVENIELVKAANQTSGAGALLGGVIGAVVGNQIGRGSGRTAATGVGAVGGALIGNQVEKNRKGTRDFVRITVRLDQGGSRQFDYEPGVDIRQGDRVYVQGDQVMRY